MGEIPNLGTPQLALHWGHISNVEVGLVQSSKYIHAKIFTTVTQ